MTLNEKIFREGYIIFEKTARLSDFDLLEPALNELNKFWSKHTNIPISITYTIEDLINDKDNLTKKIQLSTKIHESLIKDSTLDRLNIQIIRTSNDNQSQ